MSFVRNNKKISPTVPSVVLNNGQRIPIIGLGTWKSEPGEVERAVKDAIDVGYRHIDGARYYQNEHEVGAAVNAKIAEGVVKRDDLFLTSKLWVTDLHPSRVRNALLDSLNELNTPYLDLYLIHFPFALKNLGKTNLFARNDQGDIQFDENIDILDTWREMEKAVDDGLVRSIGVSNFNRAQIERLLQSCRIRPAINQIECHPYLTQKKLINYLRNVGICVTGYSPLGSPDRPWAKPGDPNLLEEQKLQEFGEKYKKSTAQILIRYQIDRGNCVIPKSVTKSRIQSNFNVFDFRLETEDILTIDSFDCNGRALALPTFMNHKNYPFHDEY